MTKEEVIEKIKKLMRMKRGGTPEEVETALALAAELARKYGIDMAGVDPDHVADQPIKDIDVVTSARLQWECKYAALVVEGYFNVTALMRQTKAGSRTFRLTPEFRVVLIGTAWDIQIAAYVYHFIASHMRRQWRAQNRSRVRDRQSFMYGMYYGICAKLDEKKQSQVTSDGLVLIGRALTHRQDYLREKFGATKTESSAPKGNANGAKLAGYIAGRSTEIRSGLTGSGKAAPMLEGGAA